MTIVTRIDLTRLDQITKELEPRAEKILDDVATRIEVEAKKIVIYDTHALQNSITWNKAGRLRRLIHDQVTYGIYVELGHLTKKFTKSYGAQNFVPAHPFMTPAVEKVRATFNKMWEALFK